MSDDKDDADPDDIAIPIQISNEDTRAPIPGYGEYEIDIEAVLRDNLPTFFERIPITPLTKENIEKLPPVAKGAYMLFRGDDPIPVYAGKTDADKGFRQRLARHAWTIQGRRALDPSTIGFKAVRVMVFAALDVEALLIKRMKEVKPGALSWNFSGFGSNDPGKRRDGQQPANFDQWYPIDYDVVLDDFPVGELSVKDVLRAAKDRLPFLLRHAKIPDSLTVDCKAEPATLRSIMALVMSALPAGWQCTVLHGRVILYPKHEDFDFYQEVHRT